MRPLPNSNTEKWVSICNAQGRGPGPSAHAAPLFRWLGGVKSGVLGALLCGCFGVAVAQSASAVSPAGPVRFAPAPSQVVLSPSAQALGPQSAPLREAEREWRRNPQDEAVAVRYARAAFLLGLAEGDLRWYGAAKAALLPWWSATKLSADGHFMRGLVKQGFHDFAGGLADLDAAIALSPDRAEMWSWRFSLHLLQSDMAAARRDCTAMAQRFGTDEGQACEATLLYRSGQAAQALPLFARLVTLPDYQGESAQSWLRFHQGHALWVAGQAEQAAAVWRTHLATHPRSHGIRLALVELLNATGQHAEALRWAEVSNPTDALLVQQLLASEALKNGRATQLASTVAQRLDAQALRGEGLIERPQMVFLITHGHDVAQGLKLAQANWATQNEPADGVLLVQAALKLKQPQAAKPVLDWAAATGYTDPVLQPLLAQAKQALAAAQGGN